MRKITARASTARIHLLRGWKGSRWERQPKAAGRASGRVGNPPERSEGQTKEGGAGSWTPHPLIRGPRTRQDSL